MVKVSDDGQKVTSLPRFGLPSTSGAGPTTLSGATTSPWANSTKCSRPSRQTRKTSFVDKALTTDTPTPCRPPETL